MFPACVAELHSPQPVLKPLLHQSGPLSGGARQGLLLEDRPRLRRQADRAGLQEASAQGSALLQDPRGTTLVQVRLTATLTLTLLFSQLLHFIALYL